MKLDPEYACEYRKFMNEYEALGHIRAIPDSALPPESSPVFYLPHHAIQQVSDQTRKIRVVFNASCKVGSGPSVNECLHTGPLLQLDLIAVIYKWRLYRIAIEADIEKMYRQILVDPADIDLQRILWLRPDGRVRHYQLLTVTYKVSCAPYLALRVIRQLARDESERFPRAAQIIFSSSYVDDILYGADDISTARQLRDELIGLTSAGGFRLHKWSSSHPRVLDDLHQHLRLRPEWKDFSPEQPVKTLGVAWHPSRDELRYRLPKPFETNTTTKREALSVIARFFDPLGWVSPIIVSAKVLLQDMWLDKLGWDDILPSALSTRWQSFISGLLAVTQIRIPRWIGASSSSLLELHGFADASKGAYTAVVYAKVTGDSPLGSTRILDDADDSPAGARCRVPSRRAPLQAPNWAWSADGSYARMVSLNYRACLDWIQQLLPQTTWKHVSSEDNPADLASRGVAAARLSESELWWKDPSWLAQPPSSWPDQPAPPVSVGHIHREDRSANRPHPPEEAFDFTTRFSRLECLLRTVARCLRFKLLTQRGWWNLIARPISLTELNNTFHACVRHDQSISFQEEINVLRRGHALRRRSRLSSLTPFLDAEGILRVGGRLEHAQLPYDQRHPVIIPRKYHLGRLVIDRAHKMALHGGHSLTYAYAMRTAWIIGGRAQTRAYVRQCVVCTRARAKPAIQMMGNLPLVRIEPARPFSRTGLDYGGPFFIKASVGRGIRSTKGYLAVFVCMCTKAVHLELVGDLTTKSFLGALHRFSARKTTPCEIWSDNATTFHGADVELKALFREARLDWHQVSENMAASGVSWNFIPPSAPHFGGLWEAAVKSAKALLKKTVGQRLLTYEEMSTLIARVESCLNSRPLTPLSGEIDDL